MPFAHAVCHFLLVGVLAQVVTGCATAPPTALEAQNVPASFTGPIAEKAPVWPKADWWKSFGSTELDGYIADARKNNLDLAEASARVLQARAQTDIADSTLFPSLGLSGNASRTGPNGSASKSGYTANKFGLSLDASYELDLWGRVRNNARAAAELLKSSIYNKQTVTLTVTASVANSYLDVLALRQRVGIAGQNINTANRILSITKAKVTNGIVSRLDLAQQQALVFGEKAQILAIQEAAKEARFGLAVLLGRAPEGFEVEGDKLDGIVSPKVAPGLPSELLRRRPDVAAAEAQLAAAHANVDAARAAFFPQINLATSGGYASRAVSTLFDPASLGFNIGASLLQTIFDGGKLIGQSRLAKAQELELVANYRKTILNAFKDVETALNLVASYTQQEKYKVGQVQAASQAFSISESQYREGVTDLLTVLQAQQTLFSAQDQLVQIRLARMQVNIGLYKALGGSWRQDVDGANQIVGATNL